MTDAVGLSYDISLNLLYVVRRDGSCASFGWGGKERAVLPEKLLEHGAQDAEQFMTRLREHRARMIEQAQAREAQALREKHQSLLKDKDNAERSIKRHTEEIAHLKQSQSQCERELSQLKGLFSGKRRRELESAIAFYRGDLEKHQQELSLNEKKLAESVSALENLLAAHPELAE